MAYRKVDGVFWTDPKVRALTEQERYLFLYLITCPSAHSSGIYYNPLPMISYETGIPEKGLTKALETLREGSMVYYGSLSGVVFVKNMLKFQKPNANEKTSIAKHLETIQDKKLLVMFLDVYTEYWEGFDKALETLREPFGNPIHTKTKTKTKTKTEIETETNTEKEDDIPELFEDPYSFESVFKMYGKKGNRKTAEPKWNKLTKEKKRLAVERIPAYVRSTPDTQFRKNFETYINKESWNDKIMSNKCKTDDKYIEQLKKRGLA